MKKRPLILGLAAATLLTTGAATFGGWAILTVDELPEYVTAGRPFDLAFTARQHAVSPLNGIKPRVILTSGSTEVSFEAKASSATGRYVASIAPPKAGAWGVKIKSGFGNSDLKLRPLIAIGANAPVPKAMALAERGEHLFFAKSCATCHVRGDVGGDGFKFGPELTGKRYVPDVVAKFIADPTSGPLVGSGTSDRRMPQLNLKEREIASIVAYLNSEGKVSTRN